MNIQNLSLTFGTQVIFDDVTINIKENEKVGLIGDNGAGKSTLFKIILKEQMPDTGFVTFKKNTRIGFLPQIIEENITDKNITVFDYLLSGRPIKELERELEEKYIEASNESDNHKLDRILKRISKIQELLEYYDVYEAENILLKILSGMNFSDELLNMKLHNLSGGQKSKVAFARLLYSNPEVILLDEPTNHLDKESKDYIFNYLKNYNGSVYIISHDPELLNAITTKTLFLDKRTKKMELYNGNYDYFKKVFHERNEALKNQVRIQEAEEKKLRDIVLLYSNSSGNRKKMAQDREKKLEKLLKNKITILDESKKANVNIEINRNSTMIPLRVNNLTFKYENSSKMIIDDLSFELLRGEKFLIVGRNGIGKSTLLKLIVGILKPISGSVSIAEKTDIGYYAQEHEILDLNKNILDNFRNINISERNLRAHLGNFLFTNDDVYKMVSVLSPGERSRVALAKLALLGANFLILDEPTNHLDPETQKIIADVFKKYTGTMLVVSHNLEFVSNLGISRLLNLETGEISYYNEDIVKYYYELSKK